MQKVYKNFSSFYPDYLAEHKNRLCRRCHFIGTLLSVILLILFLLTLNVWLLILLPIIGYGAAWIGHYFFEKNKPATFKHPFYSFIGDWVMFWEMLQGKIKF